MKLLEFQEAADNKEMRQKRAVQKGTTRARQSSSLTTKEMVFYCPTK
jgi:hypothetical protein